jgi:hypothetical protein
MTARSFVWMWRYGAAMLLIAATVGLAPQAQAQMPPSTSVAPAIPAGMARIWIYREANAFDSAATPYLRLNDAVVGVSQPGGVLYRDVAPGTYTVTADSYGTDVNQFATVIVGPAQTAFVKVIPMTYTFGGTSRGGGGYGRDTFYTWLMSPQYAVGEIWHLPAYAHG